MYPFLYIHKDVKLIYEQTEGWQVCVIDENGREIEISDPSWDVQVRPEVRNDLYYDYTTDSVFAICMLKYHCTYDISFDYTILQSLKFLVVS